MSPRDPAQPTETQADAFWGSKEERLKKGRWLMETMLPYRIRHLKELIASGKRYERDESYTRVSLHLMLLMSEKVLHLLKTTTKSPEEIYKLVAKSTHTRPIYLLPRFGEPTLHTPISPRFIPFCVVKQKNDSAVYNRSLIHHHKRWQRISDTQFEYVKPKPEQPNERRKSKSAASEKKPREQKSVLRHYVLGFHKRVSIAQQLRTLLGNQARVIVYAQVEEHRSILRERLKTTAAPENEMLITKHTVQGVHDSVVILLMSYVEKATWSSKTVAKLQLKTISGIGQDYEEFLGAVDYLSCHWKLPIEIKLYE